MAKKSYYGVDGKARKIKKWYYGVDNKARKVKKGYIGVGGVARPFIGGGTPGAYGEVTALGIARAELAGASNEKYALFAGGTFNYTKRSESVEVYDSSLNKGNILSLSVARSNLCGYSSKSHAVFAGGTLTSGTSNVVEAFDTTLNRSMLPSLSVARTTLSCASVGDCFLFAGGSDDSNVASNVVDAYSSTLTKTESVSNLEKARYNAFSGSVGNHAIFAGGMVSNQTGGDLDSIELYNRNLVRSTSQYVLSAARSGGGSAVVGDNLLFAGGNRLSTVDVINGSLVCSNHMDSLSTARSITNIGNCCINDSVAVFAGGQTGSTSVTPTVDAYTSGLVRTSLPELVQARTSMGCANIGEYVLFAGGVVLSSAKWCSTVEAYTLV